MTGKPFFVDKVEPEVLIRMADEPERFPDEDDEVSEANDDDFDEDDEDDESDEDELGDEETE